MECRCPQIEECAGTTNPVCGSNGKSYVNKCVMDVEACTAGKPIDVLHSGVCGELF